MKKINISLSIRATDDPNKVKIMLDFLEREGFSLTPNFPLTPNVTQEQRPSPPNPSPPNIIPSIAVKYGPNETEWRLLNPNIRAPIFKSGMQARFPNKEAMFAAALNGTLTQAAMDAGGREPNEYAGCPNEGAVLTGPIVILTPDENDYN